MIATVLHWEWPPWRTFIVSRDQARRRFEDAVHEVESRAKIKAINNTRDEALEALERHRETQRPPQASRPDE